MRVLGLRSGRLRGALSYLEQYPDSVAIVSGGQGPGENMTEAQSMFDWLTAKAARFGFSMSYPRGNPHGIVYEPWHWCLDA